MAEGEAAGDAGLGPAPAPAQEGAELAAVIGATVPTGFEQTAAEEVQEKLGSASRISRDRGKIYFEVPARSLPQVHRLRSVDNLFVVVQEFKDYQFNENKEDALKDLEDLVKKLPWTDPLKVWELNNSLKKKKTKRKKHNLQSPASREKLNDGGEEGGADQNNTNDQEDCAQNPVAVEPTGGQNTEKPQGVTSRNGVEEEEDNKQSDVKVEVQASSESGTKAGDSQTSEGEAKVLRFRVTCNRAGDKHSFTSNEAARDFGGAVQEHFQWKADMTNFDVEVLLNIHSNEVVVGIALTEESLHRRNITHFGPTTLRSTLAYGMLRLCDPQPTDIIVDPMCGTGAIPIEGAAEWPYCYHIAGDNSPQAVKRAANNICSLLRKNESKDSTALGVPLDIIQWDICNLPLRTGSVDIVVTDMPFGKRIGSKKKNWDLYPACLMEMGRICTPGTGRAVLLTQDKKCFAKALSRVGHIWRRAQTVWVNVGGLHAAVYLLRRTWERAEERRSFW
ncbi:THUMP domain-containing protein 3 isoform X2 [Corvus cornix cornix]|uniref:THUMP domain-containing protein 3 isoform X2 n=1 Tax=Corvus moneduloides TaxID=1196302 RepID=UPI001363D85C|nr:THUMP domain-containing protein 3 isoform X2 [Corvus moneduloides]XP_039415127.1 THUMP domain-containing protein 3 isoform X2 [Corvus cornix cornix]